MTMVMPAAAAVAAMLVTIRSRVAISSPSSRIKPQESQRGIAPLTATSLAVPHTASLPMSPPGKKIGSIT
ncbi:hypothetical protein D3C75_1331010 [compost metagenome]